MTLVLLWLVHAAPLNQWRPGELVEAAGRGAVRGAVDGPVPDDRVPPAPIRWDAICHGSPLTRGCL